VVATLALLVCIAAASEPQFPLFYQGTEELVLRRLELDASTTRVDNLANARTAVFQDELAPPGGALDDLKARVGAGMGLLVVLSPHLNATSLRTLTNGAVEQTGIAAPTFGLGHAAASEKIAATIAYLGPRSVHWRPR